MITPEMQLSQLDLWPVLPEIILAVTGCAVLLLGLLDLGHLMNQRVVPLVTKVAAVGLVAALLAVVWGPIVDSEVLYGHYQVDGIAQLLKTLVLLFGMAMLVFSRRYLSDRQLPNTEYVTMMIFATLGLCIIISAGSLLVIYLGLELMALCLYAMVAIDRERPLAAEAAMKYFVFGAIASGALLYGMSLFYGITGTLHLGSLAATLDATPHRLASLLALAFVLVGIAFKLGAVPFHAWMPDVYQGAPTSTALFVASIAKLGAVALAVRLLLGGLLPLADHWQAVLLGLGLISLIFGNLVALKQHNFKRLLAYSTMAHMGFVLLGLGAGSEQGLSAALFYVVSYAVTSLALFGMLLILRTRSTDRGEISELNHLRGLAKHHPWWALLMLMLLFSLIGVPPFVGFYAKFSVIVALLAGYHLSLAIIAVIFSVIGAFYYLNVIRLMYFEAEVGDQDQSDQALLTHVVADGATATQWVLSANALLVLVLGILPGVLLSWIAIALG